MADPKDPWRCERCSPRTHICVDYSMAHAGIILSTTEPCPGYDACTRPEKREKEETR